MKKILLLLTACMAYVCADAQTIDKTLLYGKWMLNSISNEGNTVQKDSLEQNIVTMFSTKRAKYPDRQISTADSLMAVTNLKKRYNDLFKSYAKYDEKGNCAMYSGIKRDENGNTAEEAGTYALTPDNKIIQTLSQTSTETFVIVSLTATKLVLRSDGKPDDEKHLEVSFVKL